MTILYANGSSAQHKNFLIVRSGVAVAVQMFASKSLFPHKHTRKKTLLGTEWWETANA